MVSAGKVVGYRRVLLLRRQDHQIGARVREYEQDVVLQESLWDEAERASELVKVLDFSPAPFDCTYITVYMVRVYPIRLSREDKALFKQAARAAGMSLAEFIRSAAREKAKPARKTPACLSYTDEIVLSHEAELDPRGFIKKRIAERNAGNR